MSGFDRYAYLDRIGAMAPARCDLVALARLMRAHLAVIPFENVDVQLDLIPSADVAAVFDKIVRRQRGGWCYELNTLFGALLADLGFEVSRIAADVRRGGDKPVHRGNHLCLAVHLDRPYLVDVGFGGSLSSPLPLEVGTVRDGPYTIALSAIDADRWAFDEIVGDAHPFGFEFSARDADEAVLDAMRVVQATAGWSPFVLNLVVQCRRGDGHWALRGRTLTHQTPAGKTTRLIGDAAEMTAVAEDIFRLVLPDPERLWQRVTARHEALFGADASPIETAAR